MRIDIMAGVWLLFEHRKLDEACSSMRLARAKLAYVTTADAPAASCEKSAAIPLLTTSGHPLADHIWP